MLKINSFIYNVHYVQHVQIYHICEQHTYNFVALKKGGNIVAHTVLVFGMYRKDSLSWIKHTDFIIVDILCLNLSYVLACLLWQGMNPYGSRLYRTVIFVLTLADCFVAVLSATFKNVLKRGIYVEFTQTVKHTMVLLSIGLFFLFFIKVSAKFSRIVYFSTFFYWLY